MSTLSEINDYQRTKKLDIFSLMETKLNDTEDVPVGKGQCMEAKQKSEKGKLSNGVNKEGRDNGEGGKKEKI